MGHHCIGSISVEVSYPGISKMSPKFLTAIDIIPTRPMCVCVFCFAAGPRTDHGTIFAAARGTAAAAAIWGGGARKFVAAGGTGASFHGSSRYNTCLLGYFFYCTLNCHFVFKYRRHDGLTINEPPSDYMRKETGVHDVRMYFMFKMESFFALPEPRRLRRRASSR